MSMAEVDVYRDPDDAPRREPEGSGMARSDRAPAGATAGSTSAVPSDAEVRRHLEAHGYEVIDLKAAEGTADAGTFVGVARKDGKQVNLRVDKTGRIETR